ncbi:flavin reductase family protein [Streptomyces sp. CoH27]|uniref:flavin reductase family protein n=1 Tax=Streptomyces sp. CoH27 TaxID=2875763 RepID=UPI001CD28293|nr:flavin reductase family protein [Streptomyces sp. CoH27]
MLREATRSLVLDAFSRIASTVAVVSAAHDGTLRAMTVTSFATLSMAPPRLLVCVAKTARTHVALTAQPAFAVNLLAEDQEDLARTFATSEPAKHTTGGLRVLDGGIPVVPDAAASLICHREKIHDEGDHDIVIVRVVAVATSDSPPLLHHRRTFKPVGSTLDRVTAPG